MPSPLALNFQLPGSRLDWNLEADAAQWTDAVSGQVIWRGGLLPAFELSAADGHSTYCKAAAGEVSSMPDNRYSITLKLGHYGTGRLECQQASRGLRLSRLDIEWVEDISVIALYFGTRSMTELELSRAPRLDRTFWPNWAAEGYCVPVAGSSPTSSFWRSWDLGDARLPLGSFGSAMGTPYAAAYPRPIYASAMGGHAGWIAMGPGDIPDAPLTLQLQSATACLSYSYREDLWEAPDKRARSWNEPLRLACGDSGYEALERLYATFGPLEPKPGHHQRSFLCTWGDFKEGRFDLKRFTDRVSSQTPADMIVLDDYWETFNGSGEPDLVRFPDFEEDLKGMRANGYELAFWQSIGWVDEPQKVGLTADDLLCGLDGKPRQWNWSGDPLAGGRYHYCLDPSSERTRQLIRERTERIVHRWNPAALKLDFGYGFPGPDVCVPRNPAYRGERLAAELLRLTAQAARAVNPDITIIYYGIHPLLHHDIDMINLDDLGDAGDGPAYERTGHNQRCLWAALAAGHGMAINTSTGYYWDAFDSILLDTAVVGAPGLTLGEFDAAGSRMNAALLNRWHALQTWRRSTCGWKPLWLEADMGSFSGEPELVSWGRLERRKGEEILASMALRNGSDVPKQYEEARFVQFTGFWALISQDDRGVAGSQRLACIPFKAGFLNLESGFKAVYTYGVVEGRLEQLGAYTGGQLPGRLEIKECDLERIAGFIVVLG